MSKNQTSKLLNLFRTTIAAAIILGNMSAAFLFPSVAAAAPENSSKQIQANAYHASQSDSAFSSIDFDHSNFKATQYSQVREISSYSDSASSQLVKTKPKKPSSTIMQSRLLAPSAGPAFAQTYFVPIPEDELRLVNLDLESTTGNITTSGIAIVPTKDNTQIYYDEWENGYELDLGSPTQTNTKIWGDGNTSNGNVSTVCSTCVGDVLNAGDVIILKNNITSPRNSSIVLYDGADKFSSTSALQVARSAWPVTPGTVLAGAQEVSDTSKYGLDYEIPIGENISAHDVFEHVAIFIQASKDNTSCTVNGSPISSLDQGETYLQNGGVDAGDVVQCDKPVYVSLIAGDVEADYESRWYNLFPTNQWTNNYFNPVGSVTRQGSSQDTIVFVYNPGVSSLTVNYTTENLSGSFSVPAGGVYQFTMPQDEGARFYTASTDFFAVANVGSGSSGNSYNNQTYDWGLTLVPGGSLTPVSMVGWAPGADDQDNNGIPDQNTAPIWVTPVAATTIYVDFDGDPTTGPNTAPNGDKYNVSYSLNTLQSQKIYDTSGDSDQTGMRLFTVDDTQFTAAWGEDPTVASAGNPALDMGMTVLPLAAILVTKEAELFTDLNGNGLVNAGDTLEYTITIANVSTIDAQNVVVTDSLDPNTTYVNTSTYHDVSLVPDDGVGTPFPLDGAGYTIGTVGVDVTTQVSFKATVNSPLPPGLNLLTNFASVSSSVGDFTVSVDTPVASTVVMTKTLVDPISAVAVVSDTVTFDVDITNQGPSAIPAWTLTDTYDTNCMTMTGASLTPDSPVGSPPWAPPVMWNAPPTLPTIPPGGSYTLSVQFHADSYSTSCMNNVTFTGQDASGFDIGPIESSDDVEIRILDFGDAPDPSFPTLLASNGARHYIIPGIFLGLQVDNETDGQPNPAATGDDLGSPVDDEDGVTFTTPLIAGQTAGVTVVASIPGLLNAWIDFNNDGAWSPGEQIFINQPLVAGPNNLVFPVPGNAQPGNIFSRFRFSTASGLTPEGLATDGEVEDYRIEVTAAEPGISILKTLVTPASGVVIPPGQAVFNVLIQNTGQTIINNWTLTDTYNSSCMSLVSASVNPTSPPGPPYPPPVTWTTPQILNPGGSFNLTLTFNAISNSPSCQNTASVSGTDQYGQSLGPVQSSDDVRITSPGINVIKTAIPKVINPGDPVQYTYQVSNTGDVPIANVTLSDTHCSPVVGPNPGGDVNLNGLLDPTEIWTYNCTTNINSDTTNTVTASGQPSDDQGQPLPGIPPVSDTDTANVNVISPQIHLEKTANPTLIYSGENVQYTFTVTTNQGDTPLANISLSDSHCSPITYVSGDDGDNLLELTESWIYTCSRAVPVDTLNTANVTGLPADGTTGLPLPGFPPVNDQDDAQVNVINPAIHIEKSADPTLINPGDQVTYTYLVTNPGDDPLSSISLSDNPACSPLSFLGGDTNSNNKLDPGEVWSYQCQQNITSDTTNTATATGVDSLTGQVQDTDDAFVNVIISGIQVTKTADAAVVYAGDQVTYTYEVTNTGEDPLRVVVIVDNWCGPISDPVKAPGDQDNLLEVGEVWTYTCSTSLYLDTINTVTVSGLDPLNQPLQDQAFADVNVINPAIQVEKSVDQPTVLSGTQVTYTYLVSNPGDDPLSNISLSDNPACSPLSFLGGDTNSNNKLDPDEVWSYQCQQNITSDTTNTATATGNDTLGFPVSDIDSAVVNVIDPGIQVVKNASQTVILGGGLVQYTYQVSNSGDVPLVNPNVVDDKCAPVSYSSNDDGDGILEVGETWNYQCVTALTVDTTNTVTATGQPANDQGIPFPGIPPVSDTDIANVDVINPEIVLEKTVPDDIVYAGTLVTYSYVVTNPGDVYLKNVSISDNPTCSPINGPTGDNGDNLLAPFNSETWTFTCNQTINQDTINTATAVGDPSNAAGQVYPNIDPVYDQDDAQVNVINPAIQIIKKASKTQVQRGDSLVYIYQVTNTGDAPLHSVAVADDVCSPVIQHSGNVNGFINPGETWVYTCYYTVAIDDPDPLVNIAAVTAVDQLDGPVDDSDQVSVDIIELADLVVSKLATPTVIAGENITYTITVNNLGPSIAVDVVLTDTLPTEVTIVPPLPSGCTSAGSEITCSLGNMDPGTNLTRIFLVQSNSDLEVGTSLENTAAVTSTTPDPNPTNNQDDADTSIVGEADLEITKDCPASAVAGENITCTITLTNHGPSTAQDVDVKDLLPPGVSFVSGTPDQGACVSGICQLGDVPVNVGDPITIQITGTVGSDVDPGVLTNTAEAFSDTPDPGQFPNSDSDDFTVAALADIQVTKVDLKDPVAPTEGFLYELVVTNLGPSDAQEVTATDTLDANVTFSSASSGCVHNGVNPGGVVTCTVGTLPAGESRSYLIGVTVNDVNVTLVPILTNTVSVSSTTPDDNPANNTDSKDTAVETPLGPTADLSIDKVDQTDPVTAGENVTYTLTVTNSGPSVATNVRVLELIPAGTTALSLTPDNPDPEVLDEHCSLGGACYLGKMEVGASATITVVLKVNPDFTGSTLVNTASVAGDQADTDPADNLADETTTIEKEADLSVSKVDMIDPVIAGEVLLYQITVSNSGPSDAQNVIVTDSVPANTTFVDASPECVESAGTVTCSLPNLAAGGSHSFWIQVRVAESTPHMTTLTNTVQVTSDTPDPTSGNNTDTTVTTVHQSPLNPTDLSILKSDTPDPVVAGETLTYTLTVTNNGPAPATSVMVVDALPTGTNFISGSASNGGVCNAGVTCSLGDMAIGEVVTITIQVQVGSGQFDDLYNIARVSASNPDSNPDNNDASEITEVIIVADIGVSKSVDPDPAVAGSELTYEILVTNYGPSGTPNAVIFDDLPQGLLSPVVTTSQGDCTLSGSDNTGYTLSCNTGVLLAGESMVINVSGILAGDATGTLRNYVEVISCGCFDDPNDENDDDEIFTEVEPNADLQINKSADDTSYAGGVITYSIDVINFGPSIAVDTVISDTLHTSVSVNVNDLPAGCGLFGGNVVRCNVGNLSAGQTVNITFPVTVDSDVIPGSSLENIAEVSSDTPDSNLFNNRDDADTSITSQADVRVTKSCPNSSIAGNEVVCTITVTNNGPSVAQNVDVKDLLPPGMTFISGIADPQGVCVSGICQLGDIDPGDSITIQVTALIESDVLDPTLTNTATVFSDSEDPDPSNDSASDTINITASADLEVSKIDLSDPVGPTEGLIYQIMVSNSGPSDAQNVQVSDTLPSQVTFQSASPGCTHAGGVVTCTAGTLPAGQSVSFLVAVKVKDLQPPFTMTNNVTVSSSTADPVTNNNSDSEDTSVILQPGPSADVGITKSANPTSVIAGNQVTYSFNVTNYGPQVATNVRVQDMAPFGVTVISMTPTNPDYVGEYCSLSGSCYLGTMNVSTVATIQMVVKVNPDYLASTLVNSVNVIADQADLNPANNIASATVNVSRSADLSITKVDRIDPVNAGESILYEIQVSNNGPSMAQNVTITDLVPANTSFASASPNCNLGLGNILTCNLGDLNPGQTASVYMTVNTSASLANGTTISNTASTTSGTPDPTPANNSDTETTSVIQSPFGVVDLSITKSDNPDPVIAGNLLTYTLVVRNNGPATATFVQVVDSLPAGVSFVSASASPHGACASGVICNLGNMPINDVVTITIVVRVNSSQTTGLSNLAFVASVNPDSNPDNNQDVELTGIVLQSDVRVVKTANLTTATPGAPLSYEIVVNNDGPSIALSIDLLDLLPADLDNNVASTSQGTCNIVNDAVLSCNLGDIPAGGQVNITIMGTVASAASGTLTNYVITPCENTDPNCSNNSQFLFTPVVGEADLNIVKTSTPLNISAGQTFNYTIVVHNSGPSQAVNVVVTDSLPSQVTFISSNPSPTSSPNPYTWNLGSINAGESRTIQVEVRAGSTLPDGYLITNTATVSSSTHDPDMNNNTDDALTQVYGEANVGVIKTANPNPVLAGNNLTFTIQVTNSGPSTARNVEIKDPLPAGLTFVSVTCSQGVCLNELYQLGDIPAGGSATITLVTKVNPSQANGSQICNTATKFSDTADPVTSNDSSQVCVTVNTQADLRVTKVDSKDPVNSGEQFTYTLTVENLGPSDAQAVSVSDTLPAGLTYISANPTKTSGSNPYLWDLGTIAAGATRTIVVTVQADPTASGTKTNSVTVTSTTTDPVTSNNSDTENTTIVFVPFQTDVSITKSGPTTPVVRGAMFEYLIEVRNNGPAVAQNVVVSDTLPGDISYVNAAPVPNSGPFQLVWQLGTLQSGQSVQIRLTVYVEPWAAESITNIASVTTTTEDTNSANNQDDAIVYVPPGTAVTLTEFDAELIGTHQTDVYWVTATEVDMFRFDVYRSNSSDFNTAEFIGSQFAAGQAGSGAEYHLGDALPNSGIWYYWLRMVSTGGGQSDPHGPASVSDGYFLFIPALNR